MTWGGGSVSLDERINETRIHEQFHENRPRNVLTITLEQHEISYFNERKRSSAPPTSLFPMFGRVSRYR